MKKINKILFIFLCLIGTAYANETLKFSWDHETPDKVTGYKFYVKQYPDQEFENVWNGAETSCTYNAEIGVKYGFTVTAYNEFGESKRSQEIIYTAEEDLDPIIIPSRPKSITIKSQ